MWNDLLEALLRLDGRTGRRRRPAAKTFLEPSRDRPEASPRRAGRGPAGTWPHAPEGPARSPGRRHAWARHLSSPVTPAPPRTRGQVRVAGGGSARQRWGRSTGRPPRPSSWPGSTGVHRRRKTGGRFAARTRHPPPPALRGRGSSCRGRKRASLPACRGRLGRRATPSPGRPLPAAGPRTPRRNAWPEACRRASIRGLRRLMAFHRLGSPPLCRQSITGSARRRGFTWGTRPSAPQRPSSRPPAPGWGQRPGLSGRHRKCGRRLGTLPPPPPPRSAPVGRAAFAAHRHRGATFPPRDRTPGTIRPSSRRKDTKPSPTPRPVSRVRRAPRRVPRRSRMLAGAAAAAPGVAGRD
jgi:hypothetical protein